MPRNHQNTLLISWDYPFDWRRRQAEETSKYYVFINIIVDYPCIPCIIGLTMEHNYCATDGNEWAPAAKKWLAARIGVHMRSANSLIYHMTDFKVSDV
jgi:hypothetical protein